MKGRSHRLPQSSAPPDDWGDGSWTVDCSCGVTFDDGEEMVSCDECGVWVHTRCSRFVKGEASFACHKCKAAKRHDTEETEVAQLLIELPTKTDPCPPHNPPPSAPPHRPPFRLWAEVPLEERVHVHGLPGGDPALFQGLSSSVFTSELWRCAGYVPKKFNFQYREFPCWDEDETGENPASRGADVLFSLSKEVIPCVPSRAFERRPSSPEGEVRKWEGEKVSCRNHPRSWGKKERNKIRVVGSHSNKKRKEESGEGKDRSGKKKARSDADRVAAENKKRAGSVPIVDLNKAGLCEGGGLHIAESDIPGMESEDRKEDVLSERNSTGHPEGIDNGSKPKHVLVLKASKGGLSDEALRQKSSFETPVKVEIIELPEAVSAGISSKIDGSATYQEEGSDVAKESIKKEDFSKAVHGLKQPKDESHFEGGLNGGSYNVVLDLENSRPAIDNLSKPDMDMLPDSNGAISLGSQPEKNEGEVEDGDDQAAENSELLSCPVTDGNLQGMNHLPQHPQRSTGHSSKVLQEHEAFTSLPSDEHKSQDADRATEVNYEVGDKSIQGMETGFSEPKQHGQVVEESAGSSTVQGGSFEPRHSSKYVDDPMGDRNLGHATPKVQKLVVGVRKASSTSSAPVHTRPSVSGGSKSPTATTSSTVGKAVHLTKQQVKVTTTTTIKKDKATTVLSAEENMRDVSRQQVKGHPKGLDSTGSRSSQMSRISSTSAPKHTIPDSKEQLLGQSSKASTAENKTILSGSSDAMGFSQSQNASVQIKQVPSGSCQKNEKISQPIPQLPPKLLNHPVSMHPPASVNATSTLSDEELALLLHQELNSSPRVHRVPRMRQAIGMASQTATSMLSKRCSYSGGKDQVSVFRRKNKEDASRDVSRNARELIVETKRMGRVSSSPDRKNWEPAFMADASAKKDAQNRSPDTLTSMKKNIPDASTEADNSCPPSFEASGQSASSTWTSPRDVPDDETSPTPRTLPRLVDEIMSKGKCLTYDELCNAVRPHWHNLRKPNGERYAYSSHSHAVLDCLRNRSEWAHLIDRGPKTNSSKRRRKHDLDTAAAEESETEETTKNKDSSREVEDKNGDLQREEFPKGKRKARKRRRLELRGRGVKEAARKGHSSRQGGAAVSDDDEAAAAALSLSSNDETEGLCTEDESQGTGQCAAGAVSTTTTSSGDDTD